MRLDAITLAVTWILPLAEPMHPEKFVWVIAAVFVCVSGGWAAGDVSLAAYIQSSLIKMEIKNKKISPLAAVMSFLYSIYIIFYAISSPLLGRFFDQHSEDTRTALFWVAGVGYSTCGVIIFVSTFIPKGSFAFNPNLDPADVVDESAEDVKRPKEITSKAQV